MYIYMGHMTFENTKPYEDWFWEKNKIELVYDHVESVDIKSKSVTLRGGGSMSYGQLVIATGSRSNRFGWPGQDLPGVQGLYSLQDVELLEQHSESATRAVIVGGGLIGVEMAEMLHSRGIHVTFLVREAAYWDNILPKEEAELVGRHIRQYGIDLKLSTQLKEIKAGPDGRVGSVITDQGDEIPCQVVGLTVGVSPNIEFVKSSGIECNRGVMVNEFLETSVTDVFSAGDCAEFRQPKPRHPKIEQLWYTGRMQAEALALTLCGERTAYDRGIWFNSAKFFDLEYQTYGFVSNSPVDGERSLVWQHANAERMVRIVYSETERNVIGFNFLGIRYRHKTCEKWIRERRTIEYVLQNLGEANFDPEFFEQLEAQILTAYTAVNPGVSLKLEKRRSLFV